MLSDDGWLLIAELANQGGLITVNLESASTRGLSTQLLF